jgi:hypothetical protein
MSQTVAEILIIVATAIEAGLLMFIAEVIQKIMNEMDEAAFKHFLSRLEYRAMRSPTAFTGSLLTSLAAIPYFIFYGFSNWWFTAGIAVWYLGAVASKIFNLPIYRKVAALDSTDTARLREERRKLQSANTIRAMITFLSVVLMVIGLA